MSCPPLDTTLGSFPLSPPPLPQFDLGVAISRSFLDRYFVAKNFFEEKIFSRQKWYQSKENYVGII